MPSYSMYFSVDVMCSFMLGQSKNLSVHFCCVGASSNSNSFPFVNSESDLMRICWLAVGGAFAGGGFRAILALSGGGRGVLHSGQRLNSEFQVRFLAVGAIPCSLCCGVYPDPWAVQFEDGGVSPFVMV